MKRRIHLKKILQYWPEILILLLCGILFLTEIGNKKGYHMDELLSFELSNAEFNPWIVPTQPQGRLAKFVRQELRGNSFGETFSNLIETVRDVFQNRGDSKLLSYTADVYEEPVWIGRETFQDYITVNEEDDFNYLSVYFNVKDDNHPPLHFMVLHTVSSIFQEKITPLMGCGINLVCVLGIMLLLMKLGRQFMELAGCSEGGRIVGDGAALLYGLSAGALATVLLIRMYAMLAFFCTALLEIHVAKVCGGRPEDEKTDRADGTEGFGFLRKNKLLILVTVLGFWTQYFFLFYCIILAGVTAIILWREKRRKELWRYVCAMVTAAVIGLAAFPFAVSDVFSSGRGVEALQNLSAGLSGYGERLLAFGEILLKREGLCCIGIFLLTAAAYLVFRIRRGKKTEENGALRIREFLALLCIPAIGYFLLAARMSPYLVDRYLMPMFPITALIFAGIFPGLLLCSGVPADGWKKRGQVAAIFLLLILGVCQIVDPARFENDYRYRQYAGQEETAREYASDACICVYEGVGYYENLPEFTHYEKTLLVTLEELAARKDTESLAALDEVVVVLKEREDEARLRKILGTYGLQLQNALWQGGAQEDDEVLLFAR